MGEGIVRWFNDRKGHGLINQEEGQDIFVHQSGIGGSGLKTLDERDRLTFDVEQGIKKFSARYVCKL